MGYGIERVGDGVAHEIAGSCLGSSEMVFDLGEELFDRIEVGRVFRQEDELGTGLPDGLADGFGFMGAEIVHDDDIAGDQGRHEHLLDIDLEALAVDRPVEEPRRLDPIAPERRQEGHRVPMAERSGLWQSLTSGRPAAERRHVGFGPGLVNKDEAGGINLRPELQPLAASAGNVGALALAGDQRLFL